MDPTAQTPFRWWTFRHLLLAAGLVVVTALLVWAALNPGLRAATTGMVLALRQAGPWVFFLAMALLPALGFPMMAFTLAAGPVFGPTLGTGGVIACAMAAVSANLLLSYWLAVRALRPLVGRLLAWFNFKAPRVPAGGAWQLTLIVRLMPGPPFWAQSYLLGVMRVPLLPYFTVSLVVMAGYVVALVSGGEAIAEGRGGLALTAAGLLLVVFAALQLLRRRTLRLQAEAARPSASTP